MFAFLSDAIGRLFNILVRAYDIAKNGLAWFWATLWTMFLYTIHEYLSWIYTAIATAAGAIAEITNTFDGLQKQLDYVGPFFAFADQLVPFTELFECMIASGTLIVLLTVYRLVKSWIPTLS